MMEQTEPQEGEAAQAQSGTGGGNGKKRDWRTSDIHLGERWDIARFHPNATKENPAADDEDLFLWDIYFGANYLEREEPAPVDEQELAFKSKIEQTLGVLKAIYRPAPATENGESKWARFGKKLRRMIIGAQADHQTDAWEKECEVRFKEAFDRLFSLTTLAFTVKNVDLRAADGALETLRNETLMREGSRIKNHYMFKLGAPAFGAAVIFLLLYLLYDKSPGFFATLCGAYGDRLDWMCAKPSETREYVALFPSEAYRFRAMFLLLAGCMIGTWLSFAARKVTLAFTDLAELEGDRLAPRMRLLFTGSLAVVFSLFFITGVVEFRFSSMSTGQIMQSGTVALLIGLIFGLLEQSLPAAVMDRARGVFETGKAKTTP